MPRRLVPLALVAAVAVAVRLPGVYTQAFWQDEVASARILAQGSLGAALARIVRTESTPPLWYVVGWVAHHGGLAMRDVRLVSVVAGALLAAATTVLARRVVAETPAVLAGLLVALGVAFVAHGQELRAYELFALVTVLFALSLLAELDAPSRWREGALAATTASGALTHYFFLFSAAAALAWLWLDPAARRIRRRATAAVGAGAVLTLPWAPFALRQLHQDRFWWIGPFTLRRLVSTPLRLFTPAFDDTHTGLALSVAALAFVAVGAWAVRRSPAGRLAAVLALLPLALAGTGWALGWRIYAQRNLIAIGPFLAVSAAAAVAAVRVRPAVAATAAAAVCALAASLAVSNTGRVPPYDVMARELVADGWRSSIPIAVYGNPLRYRAPLEWYLPHRPVLALARARPGGCRVVLVVTPRGRVERERVHGRLRRATYLGEAHDLPPCVRPLSAGHAALA
ncbi:MAG TPA: glycosyltransferase family 39 protein [Gaiellaceae bacterium]|nr:glycosyltransferase family 39 protein [Gaiellaceae bacterium]